MGKATRSGAIGSFRENDGSGLRVDGGLGGLHGNRHHVLLQRGNGLDHPLLPGQRQRGRPLGRARSLWEGYAGTPGALVTHVVAMGMGLFVVSNGVKGIETAAKFLIPVSFPGDRPCDPRGHPPRGGGRTGVPLHAAPGGPGGLQDLAGSADPERVGHRRWLGLVLTYAIYMRSREDTALNAFVIGFGNNAMSLLAGIMVLCTVFAVLPDAADQIVGVGNEG